MRVALFDMDGVLLDSHEAWFHVVAAAGERFRGRAITRDEFTPTFGQGTAADVRVFGLDCSPAQLDAFYVDNFARYVEHVWVNPAAVPLLQALRREGVRCALVTNTVSPLTRVLLSRAELVEHFEVLACADLVPHAKPAPDLVLYALALLGASAEQARYIGDSRYDREAAKAAGVYFVGLGLEGDAQVTSLSQALPLLLG